MVFIWIINTFSRHVSYVRASHAPLLLKSHCHHHALCVYSLYLTLSLLKLFVIVRCFETLLSLLKLIVIVWCFETLLEEVRVLNKSSLLFLLKVSCFKKRYWSSSFKLTPVSFPLQKDNTGWGQPECYAMDLKTGDILTVGERTCKTNLFTTQATAVFITFSFVPPRQFFRQLIFGDIRYNVKVSAHFFFHQKLNPILHKWYGRAEVPNPWTFNPGQFYYLAVLFKIWQYMYSALLLFTRTGQADEVLPFSSLPPSPHCYTVLASSACCILVCSFHSLSQFGEQDSWANRLQPRVSWPKQKNYLIC